MASQRVARRKPASERREEIIATATAIALEEGLESLTLRRVADELQVFPGLLHHYFRSVDDLLAVAFCTAATADIDEVFAEVDAHRTPVARMRALLAAFLSPARDRLSLLWLDAWHAARRRPVLGAAVTRQMLADESRVGELIEEGIAAGAFRVVNSRMAARRILAVVDGLSIHAALTESLDFDAVQDLVVRTAERELGLRKGRLQP
jgi:AcrR family transcriptional regulator